MINDEKTAPEAEFIRVTALIRSHHVSTCNGRMHCFYFVTKILITDKKFVPVERWASGCKSKFSNFSLQFETITCSENEALITHGHDGRVCVRSLYIHLNCSVNLVAFLRARVCVS